MSEGRVDARPMRRRPGTGGWAPPVGEEPTLCTTLPDRLENDKKETP
jgi:hypothetical protein